MAYNDSYIYYCRNCGKILFGPEDIADEDRECPNCGEKAEFTGFKQEKWESLNAKTREWQIDLWKNQTEYDASIVEHPEDYETDDEKYADDEDDGQGGILSQYTSVVRDWQTDPPEEDGEYIIWFIRRDKDPSSRKLVFRDGLWLDAKGEEIGIEKYHPALWMKLPTFSDGLIEMYRNI